MVGAIAGDIIGSIYEHNPIKTKEFQLFDPHCRFTDDSVLSIAVAKSILDGTGYLENLRTRKTQIKKAPEAGGSFQGKGNSQNCEI